MSWYRKKLIKMEEEQEKIMHSAFSKESSEKKDYIDSAVLIITNMFTDLDFQKIKREFFQVEGMIDVKRFQTKKIQVRYDNRLVTLQHLAYTLQKTGYNYVRRICKNCVKD